MNLDDICKPTCSPSYKNVLSCFILLLLLLPSSISLTLPHPINPRPSPSRIPVNHSCQPFPIPIIKLRSGPLLQPYWLNTFFDSMNVVLRGRYRVIYLFPFVLRFLFLQITAFTQLKLNILFIFLTENSLPTISCPAPVTVTSVQTNIGNTVTYDNPVCFDAEDGIFPAVCNPLSGTFFMGVSTVTCTCTDSCDESTLCSFQVTVLGIKINSDKVVYSYITFLFL